MLQNRVSIHSAPSSMRATNSGYFQELLKCGYANYWKTRFGLNDLQVRTTDEFNALKTFLARHVGKAVEPADLEFLFNATTKLKVKEGARPVTYNALMAANQIPFQIVTSRIRPDPKNRNKFATIWSVEPKKMTNG